MDLGKLQELRVFFFSKGNLTEEIHVILSQAHMSKLWDTLFY